MIQRNLSCALCMYRSSRVIVRSKQIHKKLLHIENAMSRPLELAGPPAYTLHRSMVIIVIMNSALGLFGYLRYGDRCAGSISLNLPQDNQLVPMLCVLLFLGHNIICASCAIIQGELIKKDSNNNIIKCIYQSKT